ncbi:hypothetical protein SAMN02745163_01118 [Clostridium cavendishii DSM 21758]|uniref:DUF192 domain-containing protein n=1 Tax=Clostridium cavendishii DSM 21758 TaxID=1121302 RepID=A0A1M6FEU2_9CLOT|nr:DUF192 domain-containing protein [Clostridium cavendishii]SHI96185.1 hypothetical protein SAMN02745163_01118 [Clostridium cavendishii DSM 21758]
MVKNLLYQSKVISEIFIADSFIKRFLGLMFRKNPHHEAILIKPCNSIHTFFMNFDIDVLFINENMEVIKKTDALKPGKVVFPQKKCKMIIEGRVGIFKDIKVGEKLEILSNIQ